MGIHNGLRAVVLGMGLSVFAGCASIPVEEYASDADPNAEIAKVQAQRADLLKQHADVLSPTQFKKADGDLNDTIALRSDNAANDRILDELAKARTGFNQAREYTMVATESLGGVIKAREDAVKAKAPELAKDGFAAIDRNLRDVAKDIEDNNKAPALKLRGDLEKDYRGVELTALQRATLGVAGNNKELAEREGAKEYAARTLAAFNGEMGKAQAYIDANRQDQAGLDKLRTDMTASADHLLKVTRESKATGAPNGETIVLQREAEERRTMEAQTALAATSADLQAREAELAAARNQTQSLEAQRSFEEKIKGVKSNFTSTEADVFQQGNSVILRLKGLDFDTGTAVIKTSSYGLLNKVRDVVQSFGSSTVAITGHTDAVGSSASNKTLSMKRAEAVQQYMTANLGQALSGVTISADGLGDTQPLASNKTKAGRAMNRRVDITITPSQGAQATGH